jgi:copper transport protein
VLLSLCAGMLLLVMLTAPGASAHAVVVASDPMDGARLKQAPTSVTVRFDEPVGLALGYLRVVDSVGRRVDAGPATHPGGDGSAISVPLKAGLGDGNYLASFRVVSADSHPVAGSIRFVVGNGPLGTPNAPSPATKTSTTVSVGLATSHWLSFAGVALVGGSWLIFSVWPAGQRRRSIRAAVWTGWAFAAVAVIGEFVLQGPYAAGTSLSTAWHTELLDATLHVNTGQLLSLRLVLLGVLGVVLTALFSEDVRRRPSWGPEAAAIVGVGIVVTYAATGHSQSANPKWLAILIASLHLAAMIVWLGGLAIMLIAALTRPQTVDALPVDESPVAAPALVGPRAAEHGLDGPHSVEAALDEPPGIDDATAAGSDDATELAAGLPIFSRVALASVATLAVTGTIMAWRELGTVDAIATTTYGLLVVAKVALLGLLIVLGYFSRRIVLRRDWARGGGPLPRMRRALLAEVLVGAVVIVVSGVLISQPQGSLALAAQRSKPKTATVQVTQSSSARVTIDPGKHGTVEIEVQLSGAIKPSTVTGTASLPAKSLGPITLPLQADGSNTFTASGVILPSSGRWQITLVVQTSQFDSTTAVATIPLS